VEIGLGRMVALSLCGTAHPFHARFTNIFGASMSETTMRPDPIPRYLKRQCDWTPGGEYLLRRPAPRPLPLLCRGFPGAMGLIARASHHHQHHHHLISPSSPSPSPSHHHLTISPSHLTLPRRGLPEARRRGAHSLPRQPQRARARRVGAGDANSGGGGGGGAGGPPGPLALAIP
jgi:hypothetical protein